jgi:hypothetical protein
MMKKTIRHLKGTAAAFAAAALLSGGPAYAAEAPAALTISAGALGQTWYMLAAHLGEVMKEDYETTQITVMAGGGLANIKLVDEGVVEFGMTSTDLYAAAMKGTSPFDKVFESVMGVANFQAPSAFYFMVDKSKGLHSIQEFVDQKMPLRICTFKKTGPPAVSTLRLLDEYGVTEEDIESWGGKINYMEWRDCVALGRDGHIDAMLGTTSLPSPFHAELASARDVELLGVPADKAKDLQDKFGYLPITIPKGTFSGLVEEDLPVFGYYGYVIANRDVPDDVVYELTKQMYDTAERIQKLHRSFDSFDPNAMATGFPGPLHPGAERFYKEKGILK